MCSDGNVLGKARDLIQACQWVFLEERRRAQQTFRNTLSILVLREAQMMCRRLGKTGRKVRLYMSACGAAQVLLAKD